MKNINFIQIPKTGSSSVKRICLKHRIRVFDHNTRNNGYHTLDVRLKNLEKKWYSFLFDDPVVFSIVRNPWDRVISSFFYLNQGGCNLEDELDRKKYLESFNGDFKRFVKSLESSREILEQIHFRPQYQWICDSQGNLIVENLAKFESLEKDLSIVGEKIGFSFPNLPHINKSKHLPYQTYYDEETKKIIGTIYERDISLFGYTFMS